MTSSSNPTPSPTDSTSQFSQVDGADGEDGINGIDGEDGANGEDGKSCTLAEGPDGTATLQCGDETITLSTLGMGGSDSTNNSGSGSCTVSENSDGSATISCPDGSQATVYDGADGTDGMDGLDGTVGASCSVVDNADGSATITCPDGSEATVFDGEDGVDGEDGGGVLRASDRSTNNTGLGEGTGSGALFTGCVAQQNLAVTIEAPTAGVIHVSGTVAVQIDHTSGTGDTGYVGIATSATCPVLSRMSPFEIPANASTTSYFLTVPVAMNSTVGAESSTTFYVVGAMTDGYDSGDHFYSSDITAIFVPN